MSKREFLIIVCIALALAIALPFMARSFMPRKAEPEPLPGVPYQFDNSEDSATSQARLCEVSGRCVDSLTNAPVEARVTLICGSQVVVTWPCAEDGRFRFQFKPQSNLRMEIGRAGFETRTFPLPPNDVVDAGLIVLEPHCSVRFYILMGGERVSPNRVSAMRLLPLSESKPMRVDLVQPRYGLPEGSLRPGTWRAVAHCTEYNSAAPTLSAPEYSATFTVAETKADVELRPRMPGTAEVVVRTFNHRQEALPNATVVLEAMGADHECGVLSTQECDEQGIGRFGGLPAGTYLLWATDGDHVDRSKSVCVSVTDRESRELILTASCKPDISVVITRDGKPWPKAFVALVPESQRNQSTVAAETFVSTDAAGRATLKSVWPGAYVLRACTTQIELSTASFADVEKTVSFNNDQTLSLDLDRPPGATVSMNATVLGAIGPSGVSEVEFVLQDREQPRRTESRRTGDFLLARFENVQPGSYRAWVRAKVCVGVDLDGWGRESSRVYAELTRSAAVAVGSENEQVSFELEAESGHRSVHLVNQELEYPFKGSGKLLHRHPGEPHYPPWATRSHLDRSEVQDGSFWLPIMACGRYEVLLVENDSARGIGTLDIVKGSTDTKLVLRECGETTLSVELKVDSWRPPITNAELVLRPEWGAVRRQAVSGGRCVSISLPPGKTTLALIAPGFNQAVTTVELGVGERQSISLKPQALGVPAVVWIEGATPEEITQAAAVVSDAQGTSFPVHAYPCTRDGEPALALDDVPLQGTKLQVFLHGVLIYATALQPKDGERLNVRGQKQPR
jgi:hypothetical protein